MDVSPWLRPDGNGNPQRSFRHACGRGKDEHRMILGWPCTIVAALETGRSSWTVLLDAVPATAGRGRHHDHLHADQKSFRIPARHTQRPTITRRATSPAELFTGKLGAVTENPHPPEILETSTCRSGRSLLLHRPCTLTATCRDDQETPYTNREGEPA